MKVEAALAFGGNIGDPVAAFATALKGLREHSGVTLGRLSSIYRTPPWGKTDQPEFLNMAVLVETSLQPADLLAFCLELERAGGRERRERWGPRTLDLDLLDYNGLVRRGRLKLPHPGIPERDFWLTPLMELVPRWRHPVKRQTAQKMRSILSGFTRGGVVLDKPAERES